MCNLYVNTHVWSASWLSSQTPAGILQLSCLHALHQGAWLPSCGPESLGWENDARFINFSHVSPLPPESSDSPWKQRCLLYFHYCWHVKVGYRRSKPVLCVIARDPRVLPNSCTSVNVHFSFPSDTFILQNHRTPQRKAFHTSRRLFQPAVFGPCVSSLLPLCLSLLCLLPQCFSEADAPALFSNWMPPSADVFVTHQMLFWSLLSIQAVSHAQDHQRWSCFKHQSDSKGQPAMSTFPI